MTDQERVEEFVKEHEPPFKMIGRDSNGNITFCVPIPGQEHHDLDDVDSLEDAWVKYIREVLPDVKIKKKYRTASIAGEVTSVPKRRILITITHPNYQNATSFHKSGSAHLELLQEGAADNLEFKNGQLYFNGLEAYRVNLVSMYTKKGISEIDLQTLRILYSVILHNIAPNIQEMIEKDILGYEVQLYVPDLLEMMGFSRADINQDVVNYAVAKIYSYHNILGIMQDSMHPRRLPSMYPVMLFHGYDEKKNVVRFASPYIGKVIQEVFGSSIRVNRHGSPKLKQNGQPLMLPSHSYLIKAELAKARNKRAAEIVCIVVTVIEQAGDNTPHIKASTIIERDPALQQSLEGKLTKDKNIVLKRAFSNAWKYLEKYTYLREKYKDIQLPSPSCYPTTSTLDMTFEFPHKGKC